MTRKEIQDALRDKGITQRELAKEAEVAEATISMFLRRKFKSKRLADLLDEKLGTFGAIR